MTPGPLPRGSDQEAQEGNCGGPRLHPHSARAVSLSEGGGACVFVPSTQWTATELGVPRAHQPLLSLRPHLAARVQMANTQMKPGKKGAAEAKA